VTVSVRLFSILRERAGRDRVELQLDDGATVADALTALARLPSLSDVLGRLPVQLAVNRDYATAATPLAEEDELALIPPLSGGAQRPTGDYRAQPADAVPRVHTAVVDHALELAGLAEFVRDDRAGAIVTFQGVTRDVSRLDYEAYREMAGERIAAIARDCASRHGLCALAAEHRLGPVALGEPSVIVAASAPHRDEAFAAAREAIDRIKSEAPIWKVEVDAAGARSRVDGTPAPGAHVAGEDADATSMARGSA
jgi:molybdopterin synthase catalytic subunit/molybdopterin converting factor small subunit